MSKEKLHIEYELKNISLSVLWTYIGTPSGLSKWFCDDLNVDGKKFTFYWQRTPQIADLILNRFGSFIRFRWEEDADTKYYFEFKVTTSELTGETALEITDFSEPDEIEDTIELWNSQVETLKRRIGA
ncbi:START-like domain-containing protein [Parabacteroides sp. FAFU027]|uniref:START-like domain-containing protein n=1 Tax=Parabacteroides sp. FAFU027 TaxID=2922715 RepID=UPI001FAF0B22|nr:START-like domain-containing protein [Parabacteroides sp. FAFU027]